MSIFGAIWVGFGKGLGSIAAKSGWDRLKTWRAAKKTASGGSADSAASLPGLVRRELESLAGSNSLPVNMNNDGFRDWLRRIGHEQLFVSVMLARAGNATPTSVAAETKLALAFSDATGDVQQRAVGAINYAISYIVEALQATQSGQQAFQRALGLASVGQLLALLDTNPQLQTLERLTDRARPMAAEFCLAGKRSWRVPNTVLPLGMQCTGAQNQAARDIVDLERLCVALSQGGRVLLFGDGGIGKTTQLLSLCDLMLARDGCIAIYLDAASWARAGKSLLEYVCERSQAVKYSVTPQVLMRLAEAGQVVLCINGWNEIAASRRLSCCNELVDLETTAPRLAWIVATRSSADFASSGNTMEVEVVGLRWKDQVTAIRANLPDARAQEVVDMLAAHNELRIAARSPLILHGLLSAGRKEGIGNASDHDLIGAAIGEFESNVQHIEGLKASPLEGHHHSYLEELAWRLTNTIQTVFDRSEALRALTAVARELQSRGLVAALPAGSDVLEALVAHHLLQLEEGGVRFAHQRFQEFFASQRILTDCAQLNGPRPWLDAALRSSGWEQTLRLVAQHLRHQQSPYQRERMIRSAMATDVGLACDLIGACGYPHDADPGLTQICAETLSVLAASPLQEVSELALRLQISTCWPQFAANLWPLLENDNANIRLGIYRSASNGISFAQLGNRALDRISSWPAERQAEFVNGIASRPENFSYIVGLARESSDVTVRRAAISVLLWEYPASDAGLKAWASASNELAVDLMPDVASVLADRSDEPDYVTAALQQLAEEASDLVKIRFLQNFPDRLAAGMELALESYLSLTDERQADPRVVTLALEQAKVQVGRLATKMAMEISPLPNWVFEVLDSQDDASLEEVRQALVSKMLAGDWESTDAFALGRFASDATTATLLPIWLIFELNVRASSDQTRLRDRHLHEALITTPGPKLFAAVLCIIAQAAEREVELLLELLLRRSEVRESDCRRGASAWIPTPVEIRQLIPAVFAFAFGSNRRENAMAYLVCLAARSDADEFRPLIVNACRRHLDLWNEYRKEMAHWPRNEARPSNPSMGNFLLIAAAACGFEISKDLLALSSHPAAENFIPEALATVAAGPWKAGSERRGFMEPSLSEGIAEGRRRQSLGLAFRQPETGLQDATDAIGTYLAGGIRQSLAASVGPKRHLWQKGNYRLEQWCRYAAVVPAKTALPALKEALASCEIGEHGTAGILKMLVHLGEWPMEQESVTHIEQLIESIQTHRYTSSDSWTVGSLASVLVCLVPQSLLSKPWIEYLQIWGTMTHWHPIIEDCKTDGCRRRWEILQLLLGKANGIHDAAVEAILSITQEDTLHMFLDSLRSGKLTQNWMSGWKLERGSKRIAELLRGEPLQIGNFRDACRQAQSGFADAFAIRVFAQIGRKETAAEEYFLDALDTGRVSSIDAPCISALESLFYLRTEIGVNTFTVKPFACIYLRSSLYERAVAGGGTSNIARQLLAKIECERRDHGRPDDEPRHPKPDMNHEWIRAALTS